MMHALTIDVEDWYQTNGLDIPVDQWSKYEERVVRNTNRLLDLFNQYNVKGTFFVLGCVAEAHPNLVREIVEQGHEVGSHGGWHQLLTRMTFEQWREDLLFSKQTLEDITGTPVRLYRAPSWSITPDKYEVLTILEEEGFVCDSSFQPFRTPLSGLKGVPLAPFHPIVGGRPLHLVEFPSTVLNFGSSTIPFSGGFYLRAVPSWFTRWAFHRIGKARPGMVYVHPWEVDPLQPRLPASPLIRLAQYYNLSKTENKLCDLLQRFQFAPLGEVIANQEFPTVKLS